MKTPKKLYYEDFQIYNTPFEVKSNCNSLTIVNVGTATAIINGLELAPTEQYFVPGNEDEENITSYRISFTGAGTNILQVIRKIYQ